MRQTCLLLALLACSCGRTQLGTIEGAGPVADGGQPRDRSLLPDRGRDSAAPAACTALGAYTHGKRLMSNFTRRARFSRDLRRLALVTHRGNGLGDLYLVSLPSGSTRQVVKNASDAQWLAQNRGLLVTQVPPPSTSTPYTLLRLKPDGTQARALAHGVCSHLATPDGGRVYVVRNCDKDWRGELLVVQTASGASAIIASGVSAFSLAVSADSKWAAYVRDLVITPGCYNATGTTDVVDAAGKKRTINSAAIPQSLQFTPHGRLLVRVQPDCKSNTSNLVLAQPGTSGATLLAKKTDYNFHGYGFGGGLRYAVSPDSKQVLGASMHSSAKQNDLIALATNGSGVRVLARDMYPYQMTSMAFKVWTFANNGQHAVYARGGSYPAMGLGAVPTAGGAPVKLSDALYNAFFVISPTSADLAWVEISASGAIQLMLGSVTGGAKVMLHSTNKQQLSSMSLLPGGREVLVVQRAGAGYQLVHAGPLGGSMVLGRWNNAYLLNSYPAAGPPIRGYQVDPWGCALVYNDDLPTSSRGTYLRKILR